MPVCLTGSPSSMWEDSPEDDAADLVLVEVQRDAEDAAGELEQLVRHRPRQALDARDAVAGLHDASDLLALDRGREALDVASERLGDAMRGRSPGSMPWRQLPSCCFASSRRLAIEPSNTSSPTRATTPPTTDGSITTFTSIARPVAVDRASAIRARCASVSGTAVAPRPPAAGAPRRRRRPSRHDLVEVASAAGLDHEPEQRRGERVRTIAEQVADHRLAVLRRQRGVGQGLAQLTVLLHGLCEREQLVLDRAEYALGLRDREHRLGVAADRVRRLGHVSSVPFPLRGHLVDVLVDQRLVRRLVERLRPRRAPASSTAMSPTCDRSSWNTRSRSARISSCARATIASRLLLGLGLDVLAQLLRGLARLLDDPVGLLAGVRELLAVLREQRVGLAARRTRPSPSRPGSSAAARRASC